MTDDISMEDRVRMGSCGGIDTCEKCGTDVGPFELVMVSESMGELIGVEPDETIGVLLCIPDAALVETVAMIAGPRPVLRKEVTT